MRTRESNQLGRSLQELREKRGWSLQFVANKLSISKSSYRDLEQTSRSKHLSKVLPKLASLFNVPIDMLFGQKAPKSIVDDCQRIQEIAQQIIYKAQ